MLADAAQQLVGIGSAVALVDDVEAVDVHHDRVHGRALVVLVKAGNVIIEVFPVEQPGQRVALGGADDLPVLGKLDDAADPGQYHASHGIGLGDEVERPELQAGHLRVVVRGHYDHGNPRQFGGFLQQPQHHHAGPHRHDQIQQDQRDVLRPLLCQFQRLLTVGRVEYAIVVLQQCAEQLPVDLLVIDHQYGAPLRRGDLHMRIGHGTPPCGCAFR